MRSAQDVDSDDGDGSDGGQDPFRAEGPCVEKLTWAVLATNKPYSHTD